MKMMIASITLKPGGGGRLPLLSLLLLLLLLGLSRCDDTITADIDGVDGVDGVDAAADDVVNIDDYYNVNETRGEFEFRIQPYPIPIGTFRVYSIV